jgi:hypothetical protein
MIALFQKFEIRLSGERALTESWDEAMRAIGTDQLMERDWSLMEMRSSMMMVDWSWWSMGEGTKEGERRASEREWRESSERERGRNAWILAFSNWILIYSRKMWIRVLFFPVFGFHSTSFFYF